MTGKTDGTELLIAHLPDLIEGIGPKALMNLLKDNEELTATVLSGFRPTAQSAKMPVVKQRIMREAEKDQALLDKMSASWVEINQRLWGRVALSSLQELRGSLNELVHEYGVPAFRIALIMDDRDEARQIVNELGGNLAEAAAEVRETALETVKIEKTKAKARVKKSKSSEEAFEELQADRARLQKQIRELSHRVRDLDRRLLETRTRAERYQSEGKATRQQLSETQKLLDKAVKTADRLQRAKEASEYDKSLIRRDLKLAQKEIQDLSAKKSISQRTSKTDLTITRPDWVAAVSALIKSQSFEVASAFCEQVKLLDPENLFAHLALEQIYAKTNVRDKEIDECNWIAEYMSKSGQPVRACAFVCRALAVDATQHRVQAQFRRVFDSIELSDEAAVYGARRLLARLKLSNPLAHRQAQKIIKQMGKAYINAYDNPKEMLHPDKVFTLSDGKRSLQISTRRIADAIDRNEVGVITFAQNALSHLKKTRPTLYRSVAANLEAHDRSCAGVISGRTMPVVVDGSNVAWHESAEKARLRNILDMRKELRSEGYFPVYIYVDASLPYQIDQQAELHKLVDSGQLIMVEKQTDADEAVLARARTLSCPIVSNDRMADWDPEGEVFKMRFAIDDFGVTVYDS